MLRLSFAFTLASLALAGHATAVRAANVSRPNILFILIDDQGYADMSCHGNPVLKTPNIDRLHDEGVRFTDFHVSPSCSPTRCALMTGRHEFKSGVTHTIQERERMSLKATTIAQVLKSAGYTTGIFGKWHLGDEPDHWPDKRGFDEMFIHGAGGIGQTYPGSCGDAPGNSYFSPAILHNGRFEKTDGYCTDIFFSQAEKWIESVKGHQPFFCYLATNAPHVPLQVRPEDEARYAGKVSPTMAKYFGMVANVDDNVGRMMAKLKEWGLDRDTLVIYMNDNGASTSAAFYNAGMRGEKCTAFEGGTRAASFWRWPGTLKPADVDRLAAHIDLFPTLAELAGAKAPDEVAKKLDGRSLVSLLNDPRAAWSDRMLVTHVGRWPKGKVDETKYDKCRVRNQRYSLVSNRLGDAPAWQLFDLQADYGEKQDIAAEHPKIVKELSDHYEQWWREVRPCMENENLDGPKENPFVTLFRQQYGEAAVQAALDAAKARAAKARAAKTP
jgi:arylsulfatase